MTPNGGHRTTQSAICSLRCKRLNHRLSRRLADSNCCFDPEGDVSANLPQSWVYVVEAGNDRIKIGSTNDPQRRISQIEREIGEELYVWACVPGTLADERRAQKRWAHLHINGDWFRLDDALIAACESGDILGRRQGLCRFSASPGSNR